MQLVNIPTAKALVREVAIKLKQPVMFVGQFGAGKSEGVQQAVAELDAFIKAGVNLPPDLVGMKGARLCDIRLGQYDSVDLKGFPSVDDTGFMKWHAASTLPFVGNKAFPDDEIIVVFYDEITSCTPPVFAVAYQLINENRVGEHAFGPNVRTVAAGNRDSDKGVVNRMPMPLANRMTWFEIGTDAEAWCDYAQSKGWPAEFVAFMMFRKPLLCTYDPAKTDRVVATPRTWEKAISYYSSDMPQDLKLASMAGCIGEGPTGEFWGFIKVWRDIIPIAQIIKDPTKVSISDEASMRYAQCVSVSGHLEAKNSAPLHAYLKRYDPEFVVMAWQLATKRDKTLFGTPEFMDFAKTYKAVFS